MTDTSPPPSREPNSGAEPTPPPAIPAPVPPAAAEAPTAPSPAPSFTPAAERPKQTLAIVSLVTGIVGIVFSFVFGLGLLPAIAAIVTGHIALKREPHARGFAIAGVITGYSGLALSILVVIVVVVPLIIAWLVIAGLGAATFGL